MIVFAGPVVVGVAIAVVDLCRHVEMRVMGLL
jgi:hypothetical protein